MRGKKTKKLKMKLAGREWNRQFYTAVVKSFPKTITEPVTNSDTSYKRKHFLDDSSGLVERALKFEKGTRFDLSSTKQELETKFPKREIELHIYTAKGHGRESKTCEVVDYAEGLTDTELEAAFEYFAGDKTTVSKNKPGRSLFGRGVSDVLLGHQPSAFASYHDGVLSIASFSFNPEKNESPEMEISVNEKPSLADLAKYHLNPKTNGSCVQFVLHGDCRIPEEGSLIPILSQFYMLRLINADPNVSTKAFRYRSGGKKFEDTLDYDFPIGVVLEKFSFSIKDPINGVSLPDIDVEGIVCKSDDNVVLPGKDMGDLRANGLLIVDDKDAVLDLTFLPQFENVPYLAKIFGIIRATNIRKVFEWYLNNGKDSPLLVTRDGFDQKHEFTKIFFSELAKYLVPIYKKEEEKFRKSFSSTMSAKTQEEINEALKTLNKFLKELGEGEGEDAKEVASKPEPTQIMQFLPSNVKLVIGKERNVKLYLRKEHAKPNTSILCDSNNSRVEINPTYQQIADGKKINDYLVFDLAIKCEVLHEKAKITALAEGKEGLLEAYLDITDVTSGISIVPPEEMEFRPKESKGQPNRDNNLTLYVNPNTVPVGRKIKINLEKSHGTIGLKANGKIQDSVEIVFEKSHILPEHRVGRILIPWRGNGWGQSSRVIAETKVSGKLIHTEGRIVIEQAEEKGGRIKRVVYGPLEHQKCSDFADGIIYINSNHYLNAIVFGQGKPEYEQKMEQKDKTARYRFSQIIVDQSVFDVAESQCLANKLILESGGPVSCLRAFVEKKTHELAPKIAKFLIEN